MVQGAGACTWEARLEVWLDFGWLVSQGAWLYAELQGGRLVERTWFAVAAVAACSSGRHMPVRRTVRCLCYGGPALCQCMGLCCGAE